jgi:Secretion system C-terminal sorting domain
MKSLVTFSIFLFGWATAVAQTTLTFTPSKDNTIYEISNTVSNGAGSSLFAGNDNVGRKHRGLMRFDLSSISSNAIITNVTLQLFVGKTIDMSPRIHELHKLSADWGEGTSIGIGVGDAATTNDATWSDRFYGVSTWSSLGGDYNSMVSGSLSIGGLGNYTFLSTSQLIADVQDWVSSPSTNYGWILIGEERTTGTARKFDSRESTTPANSPTLTVTFKGSLPIELIDFAAKTTGDKNILTWITASETNNKAFEIERSIDGFNFTAIGSVKAANKANSYQYVDYKPFPTSYYRLREIDNDGTVTFSKIVTVSNKGTKGSLKAYPTLVKDILNIETEVVVMYQVVNLFGQQVLSGTTTQLLDVSALTQGIYFLRVEKEQFKFVKQ